MNIETQMRALRLHGMERNWKALNARWTASAFLRY